LDREGVSLSSPEEGNRSIYLSNYLEFSKMDKDNPSDSEGYTPVVLTWVGVRLVVRENTLGGMRTFLTVNLKLKKKIVIKTG
jgi:hypothetical protein